MELPPKLLLLLKVLTKSLSQINSTTNWVLFKENEATKSGAPERALLELFEAVKKIQYPNLFLKETQSLLKYIKMI